MFFKLGIIVVYKLLVFIIIEISWICDLVFFVWVSFSWENCEIFYFFSWVVVKWLGVIMWVMFDYFIGDKDLAYFCIYIWGYVFCFLKDNRGNDCLKYYFLVKLYCKSRYLFFFFFDLFVM